MTIPAEKTRQIAVENALAAVQTDPNRVRQYVQWQDRRTAFDVIHLPVDMVVLNPHSHRIRSQIESLPDKEWKVIESDPFGEEAQGLLATIIKTKIEGFEDVLADLRERGQEEPGVVTRKGVLVNANRRVVALRQIDPQGYVDLLVLPPEPDPRDVARLELDIQETRDFKQAYTYTNSLLFLDEMKTEYHYTDQDAAKALRIDKDPRQAVEEIRRRTRVYALIRDIQNRSGGAVKLEYFDAHQVALEELDRQYEAQKRADLTAAEQIREARVLGILSGVQYRHLRQFDTAKKIDEHLLPALIDSDIVDDPPVREGIEAVLATKTGGAQVPKGLGPLIDDGDDGEDMANLKALVDLVAASHAGDTIQLPSGNGSAEVSSEELRTSVAEALDYAFEDAKSLVNAQKSLKGPIEALREARQRVDKALPAFRQVANNKSFAKGKFEYELKKLAHAVEAIRAEYQKHAGR